MPRESIKAKTERTADIIDGLKQTYPDARCELDYTNPLELLIATILSAQCTDKQVNIVTADLFKKYRCAADYTAVPLESLQEDIKRIGLFRNKAKSIQNCCRALIDQQFAQSYLICTDQVVCWIWVQMWNVTPIISFSLR